MCDIRLKKITVEPSQSPFIIQGGSTRITDTSSSFSMITGALVVDGGMGINFTQDAVSCSAGGTLTIGGGAGFKKDVYIGKNLVLDSASGIFNINGISNNRLFLDTTTNKNFYIAPDGVNKRFNISDVDSLFSYTRSSTNSSTGAIVVQGGISIGSSQNASSTTQGGGLTVAGGVSIGQNIIINKNMILGEQTSGTYGVNIRYTNKDQILLNNSNDITSGSINITGNTLFVSNTNDIFISSSTGTISLQNNNTTLMTTQPTNTTFFKYISITDTTESTNSSIGALVVSGGISIQNSTDAINFTSGGALTILGGIGITKKSFFGDSLAIDNVNANKSNKVVLYQSSNDLTQDNQFTGLGNTGGGHLTYQVPSTNNDHIFFTATSSTSRSEIFRVKGTGDISIQGSSQSYSIIGGGDSNNSLSFQSQTSNSPMSINMFTKDGDASDNIDLKIFATGTPNNVTNSEYLSLGFTNSNYVLSSNKTGTGQLKDIILQNGNTNQLTLSTNGSLSFSSIKISSNSSTGSMILQGGLSINNDTDVTNISNGGALTIAGGASIAKKLSLGSDLVINNVTINTSTISTSHSNLQMTSNLYPSMQLANSSISGTYGNRFTLFTLGQYDTDTNNEYLRMTSLNNNGYALYTERAGTGIIKYITIYSGTNANQLTLQTSGNIGINTSNPNYKLDVNGTLHCNNTVILSNTNGNSLLMSGRLYIQNTSDAISTTEGGSIISLGGVGIVGKSYFSGISQFSNTTPSTCSTIGSVIVIGGLSVSSTENSSSFTTGGAFTIAGGASISKDLWLNGNLNSGAGTMSSIFLSSNQSSINSSTGSIVCNGGIGIKILDNASSITRGGALTIAGGASINKDLYVGGNTNIYGLSKYTSLANNFIEVYDNLNIRRISLDKNTSSHNFSISRYDSLGNFVERIYDISYLNGSVTFNVTTPSTSDISSAIIFNGGVSINTTQIATNVSNGGGLTMRGGASIGKNLFVGGDVVFLSTTDSTSVSNGALLISGGVGVSGNMNVLGNTTITGNLTVNGQTTSVVSTNTVISDNIFVLNSGPTGSKDAGFVIQRQQSDNDSGTGDVVSDTNAIPITIPDQTGMSNLEIKLNSSASSVDNYYTNWWIKITSGFSNNQVRKITGYIGSTRIATVSSAWTTQNPSIGDDILLYNKPYVGLVYNEIKDRFEFGGTSQNPGQTNVTFTDNIPICFSTATSTSTQPSTNSTTGALLMSGGISIFNTTDAVNNTYGGTFTTLGGASINKKLYVGQNLLVNNIDITPNSGDIISSITFNAANNQSSFTNITGLIFNSNVWGFDIYLASRLTTSTNNNLYCNFHIRGINKNSSWEIIKSYVGDDTGIEFNITSSGQLQYTTPNYANFSQLVFKARAFVN
jgi:hypothetical protein